MVKLGDKVKDTITGYNGIAVSRMIWLQGCDRIGIQAPVQKDLSIPDVYYFDEAQIEVVQAKKKTKKKPNTTRGGPLLHQPIGKNPTPIGKNPTPIGKNPTP